MLNNRSIPESVVIPVLVYAGVEAAVAWLSAAFGFSERLRIGDHRAQMDVPGRGAMVVREGLDESISGAGSLHSIMVRVADANALFERAVSHGAKIVHPVTDYPYGERQFTVIDVGGHSWTFSQSIADVDPAAWGGDLRSTELRNE